MLQLYLQSTHSSAIQLALLVLLHLTDSAQLATADGSLKDQLAKHHAVQDITEIQQQEHATPVQQDALHVHHQLLANHVLL